MRERTLDQQCTVTRPGLAPIAASMAVELMVALLHDKDKHYARAETSGSRGGGSLGIIPHQIRGMLSSYTLMTPATPGFDCCTACSQVVVEEYRKTGFDLIKRVSSNTSYLEDLTGLSALRAKADDADVDWEVDDSDEDDDIAV